MGAWLLRLWLQHGHLAAGATLLFFQICCLAEWCLTHLSIDSNMTYFFPEAYHDACLVCSALMSAGGHPGLSLTCSVLIRNFKFGGFPKSRAEPNLTLARAGGGG